MASKADLEKGRATRESILAFIRSYHEENGYAPSISEIAEAIGVSSPNTVRLHLNRMKDEGIIDMTPRVARSIVVLR